MEGRKKLFIILVLGMMSAIGPFSIDMYLPGFPAIAKDLNTTVSHVSLSLSSFFIGISFGQLVYGPIIDRFGRKPPLYFGLILYLLSSIGCALVKSADALIVLRLFQALGGCAGMVTSRAMVRDIFPVKDNAKVFSLLVLVVGVSPIIAPTLGGYIAAHLGWQYIFVALTLLSVLVLLAIHFFLPDSKKPDTSVSLKPYPILRSFYKVLQIPQFYTYAITGSLASSGLYAYIAGSPYVFMEIYQISEKQYGWLFAFIAGGLIISAQINSLLLRKFTSNQIIRVALLVQCITGATLLIGALSGWLTLVSSIILIFIFLCCQGFSFPNSAALSLAPFSKNAGSASAVMGGIQMSLGALTSGAVNIFSNHTAVPMAAVMAICSLSAFAMLMLGSRLIHLKRAGDVQKHNAEMLTRT